MNIVITGGRNKADFLIASLLNKRDNLTVINDSREYGSFLSEKYNMSIQIGDASKEYVLQKAEILGSDVLIAISSNDSDNLAICQLAKKKFQIKRTICTVSNPKNVEIFKTLGVDTVISATHLISKYIEQASDIENLIQSLSLEDESVVINEILIDYKYPVAGRKIQDIKLPDHVIISCIIRNMELIIPNGQVVIYPNDKMIVISYSNIQNKILKLLTGKEK